MQRPSLIFFCKYNFIAHKNYLLRVLIFVTAFGIISFSKNKQLNNNIFKYNEYSNISSLDPAFSSTLRNIWPVNQLFNGLVKLDENLEIIDDLAHRWEISSDKKTYTFFLKKDIKFHPSKFFNNDSDRIVKADDFVYSLKRLTDPKVASSGSWVLKNVDSIYSVNDSILKIELTKEFKPFLGILSMKYCSVVPREVVENFGDEFGQNPIGTGPFLFKKWDQNIKLVLRKNDEYFEKDITGKKLPYLDGISISLIPDKKSEFMELIAGRLDMVSSPENSIIDQIFDSKGNLQDRFNDEFKLIKKPYLNTEYIGFNTKENLETDAKLRLAINHSIDRKKMIKFLRKNLGYAATSGIVPNGLNNSYKEERYNYDPEKAKKLMNEYKNEKNLDKVNITISTDAQYIDIIEFVQSELQKIDIYITIDITPPSILRQGKANGKFQAFRASWIADYPSDQNYFSLFYSKNHTPKGPNYTFFKSDEYDKLYNKTESSETNSNAMLIGGSMEDLIYQHSPVIPLYYDMSIRILNKRIKGLNNNPINMLDLRKVKKVID
jgi:ABC-type transport system substrate-binding protein